jgi:cytochrome c
MRRNRKSALERMMKNLAIQVLVLLALCVVALDRVEANQALAEKNSCLACHAVDEKIVGPSLKEIAQKYAGQEGAVAKVAEAIVKGGAGVWGKAPMPPQAQLSDADAKALAVWVLATK